MKKLILFTVILIFIPFFIVKIYNMDHVEEIKLNYVSNILVRVKRVDTGKIDTLPLEEYIVGVLAGEMPVYFDIEALKAQAVASRSYVLKRIEYNIDNDYDIVDSVLNQVYLDRDYLKKAWEDDYINNINKLTEAVNSTSGEYLEYDNEIIDAMFFSTSNGYTEDSSNVFDLSLPYLKSVESHWDSETSSAFHSSQKMSLSEFYQKLGLNYSDTLTYDIIEKSATNRNITLKINNVEISARDMYNKLGLKSTDFYLVQDGEYVNIYMTGYGHGVGMSQYGALGMALEGYNYEEILNYYYNGILIKKIKN